MPRHAAFLCLRSGSPTPLRVVGRYAERRGLDVRDSALARRLVGVEIRRRGTLRAIVAAFVHHKPKPDVATLLRLGVAQLLFLDRVPPHAAISETVRATADLVGLSKGRMVNATLRSVQRAMHEGACGDPTRDVVGRDVRFEFPVFRDPEEHPHLWAEDALSIPATLHKRWTARYGEAGALDLALLALEEPPLSIRATERAPEGREGLRRALAERDVPVLDGQHPSILLAPPEHTSTVLAAPAFARGEATIQGEHALRAAELVGDVDGASVLEVCAAPGGKAAVLRGRGAESLVTVDLSAHRLASVRGGFERLGLAPASLAAMDGTRALRTDASFDAVLVDAPCSNTGVLAQRPSARWRYGPKGQSDLASLQSRLLEEAAGHVRTGGALVHSTCSLEPEENEQIVRAFLETHDGWVSEEDRRTEPRPLEAGGPTDGGYAVRLRAPQR
ncbi:MAG: transcription antitermination factor NusB [Planctomycetota bacterium]